MKTQKKTRNLSGEKSRQEFYDRSLIRFPFFVQMLFLSFIEEKRWKTTGNLRHSNVLNAIFKYSSR